MTVTKILVLAALCATAAHAGSAGEDEHAARLEARVDAALERVLGPGRAAATVVVRGERVTKREQSQISGSSGRETPPGSPILELPGYTKKGAIQSRPPAGGNFLVHSASEETLREGSFVVSGVRARLVLDDGLSEDSAAEAVRVAREILALDPERGDQLAVVRTAFLPAWRAAFSRPRDARALALLCGAAAALILAAALIGLAATRSSRTLADALAKARATAPGVASQAASAPARRILPLPPLGKGGRGE